ncbi:hypothetical protein COL940_008847 [Colletotrichum noveboracense]|nr:hypothetical protein COL940_008847 [Colletotrichum noveboracense]
MPNAAFTDSGYASTSTPEAFPRVQIPQRSPPSDSSEPGDASIEDEIRTVDSEDEALNISLEQEYISRACQSIREKLGYHADLGSWTFPPGRLSELLKGFAIKIGLESADEANLRVMWFFHKYGE